MVRKTIIQVIEETVGEVEAEICGHCWPHGWPHGAKTAGCSHGDYERPDPGADLVPGPAADPTQQPPAGGAVPDQTKTPTADTAPVAADPAAPAAPVLPDPAPAATPDLL